jgi:glutaminyl-tRNA synthetase
VPVTLRLYDRLFTVANPMAGKADFKQSLNPDSLKIVTGARAEASIAGTAPGSRFQFERKGYYYLDPKDSGEGRLVFNRIVPLKDSWAKIAGA